MIDEDEHVQGPERERLDREQVGRPEPRSVVSQEGPPALGGRTPRIALAVALDGAPAHDDAERQELAADALGAPAWVLARHRGDQPAHLGADPRPTERTA